MYCSRLCRTSTYQCGAANYPFPGEQYRARMEICESSGEPIGMEPCFHKGNVYIKRNLQVWRAQKCTALVGAVTVLTSAGLQTTLFHWRQYRAVNGNKRNFGRTTPHGTAFAPKQWIY